MSRFLIWIITLAMAVSFGCLTGLGLKYGLGSISLTFLIMSGGVLAIIGVFYWLVKTNRLIPNTSGSTLLLLTIAAGLSCMFALGTVYFSFFDWGFLAGETYVYTKGERVTFVYGMSRPFRLPEKGETVHSVKRSAEAIAVKYGDCELYYAPSLVVKPGLEIFDLAAADADRAKFEGRLISIANSKNELSVSTIEEMSRVTTEYYEVHRPYWEFSCPKKGRPDLKH